MTEVRRGSIGPIHAEDLRAGALAEVLKERSEAHTASMQERVEAFYEQVRLINLTISALRSEGLVIQGRVEMADGGITDIMCLKATVLEPF